MNTFVMRSSERLSPIFDEISKCLAARSITTLRTPKVIRWEELADKLTGVSKSSARSAAGKTRRSRGPHKILLSGESDLSVGADAAPYSYSGCSRSAHSFLPSSSLTIPLCMDRHSQLTMSCVPVADAGDEACANCGKVASDAVKLKNCTACRLVKYCGVDCQRAHRKKHKKACKLRAAELRDEQLYSQGLERHEGDSCPICTLLIPLPMSDHSVFNTCCMKRICDGCTLAAQRRDMFDCAFCRTPIPDNDADRLSMVQARMAKKDPEAINVLALKYRYGSLGLQKDMQKVVELWTEAAELGSIEAFYSLGVAYDFGDGVQQDVPRATEFYEKAAMQGHVQSRNNLGCYEGLKGNHGRAVRHLLISAKMGYKESVENIKRAYMGGIATKEQYGEALKGYQDAVEEMMSHDRDEANALRKSRGDSE